MVRVAVASAATISLTFMLSACGQLFYSRLPVGEFEGRLIVRWVEPNQFVYLPDTANPLRYRTADNRLISPQAMYTDAGSIPRLFWSHPGLGPWDFAPAYIVHDWLFEQHHCKLADWAQYSFEDSATLLAEGIKSQMAKAKNNKPEPQLVWAIYEAVRTPIARDLWDTAECRPVLPEDRAAAGRIEQRGVTIRVIDFGNRR